MKQETSEDKIIKIENFHILLWLLKDACWVMEYKFAGIAMVIPTLGVAIYLTYKSRFEKVNLFHNLAICSWITGNSVWMVGEFFFNDKWRNEASFFFILGLIIVVTYHAINYFLSQKKATK
jgi:hypothetical protein